MTTSSPALCVHVSPETAFEFLTALRAAGEFPHPSAIITFRWDHADIILVPAEARRLLGVLGPEVRACGPIHRALAPKPWETAA